MYLNEILPGCEKMEDWWAREPGGMKGVKEAMQECIQPRGLHSN